jgi:nucleotide-binding universal stress UspA family protein
VLFRSRVLLPTDLTDRGDLAFAHALRIALASAGQLCLVHTSPDRRMVGEEWEGFPRVRERLTRWEQLPAGASTEAVKRALGLQVQKVDMPDRHPVHGVLELTDKRPFDLIVMASEGRDGLDGWLHPSVAEALARESRLPALFLPAGARGFVYPDTGEVALRRILVPVDRSPRPARAIALARDLAAVLGARPETLLFHVGADRRPSLASGPDQDEFTRTHVALRGDVVEEILRQADAIDADLIVMATHGHDGVLDVLRGSTTEQVLRRAHRPVLAVPALS